MNRPITYGDLYMVLSWVVVLSMVVFVFLTLDTHRTAERLVAYFDKSAMQYLHMRGQAFTYAEKREDGKSNRPD
jgi:hypothetical protein